MSEFDQRQYRLIVDQLKRFTSKEIDLGTVVDNLEGLLNAIERVDEGWKDAFLSQWGKLEDARAFALYKGLNELDSATAERVQDAVAQLKLMALERIDDPAD